MSRPWQRRIGPLIVVAALAAAVGTLSAFAVFSDSSPAPTEQSPQIPMQLPLDYEDQPPPNSGESAAEPLGEPSSPLDPGLSTLNEEQPTAPVGFVPGGGYYSPRDPLLRNRAWRIYHRGFSPFGDNIR